MSSSIFHRRSSTRDGSLGHTDEEEIGLVRKRLEFRHALDSADEDTSTWTYAWKFAASLLLTCALLGPFAYTSYNRYHQHPLTSSAYPEVEFFMEADKLSCAKELKINYSKLYLDVKLGRFKGVCRDKETVTCACSNPTVPTPRHFAEQPERDLDWSQAFERNQVIGLTGPDNPDVAFLGDSIMELWLGTIMATPTENMLSVTELFIDLFQDHAVVLGLSGDRCKHLLYRLQNGEMPDSLNPAAWWILIGTNDYPDSCSRESILVGQLAILYETRKRKPDALVILQGLLPRGHDNLLESSLWQDFQWINDRLACLAELPHLDFFNGTSIFLADDEQLVNETLMDDFLHPSNEGRRLWGLAIVDHLKRLNIWTKKTPADG